MQVLPGRRWMALLLVAAALALPGVAQARVYWSVGIGVPVYAGPGWYPGWGWDDGGGFFYPYAAGWPGWSPPVVVERQPVVVQQLPPGPPPPSYWYYCRNPAGYYPYVAVCPGGWTPVPATPPEPPAPSK
ncbi:hypothetical protein [Thiomonas sp.]|uniref:hypothetical protein n=1 Tax=Thiomonas sp. TaxID=2047785 RepID=UPI0026350FD0|nr:hypothetical protein [Thiomonas sp.]